MSGEKPPNHIPDKVLLADLKRVVAKLGHAPKKRQYNQHGKYHTRTFLEHFESWESAMGEIGIEYEVTRCDSISKQQMLRDIDKFVEKFGHPPERDEFGEFVDYSPYTVQFKFGSWKDAILTAGYKPKKRPPEEIVLLDLVDVAEKLQKPPTTTEYEEHGVYNVKTVNSRIQGPWEVIANEAHEIAISGNETHP